MGRKSTFIPGRGATESYESYGADLRPCPQIQGDDQKKFLALNLRLRLGVHSCVLSWNETLFALTGGGGTSGVLGETGPKTCTSGTGHVTLFWGTILAWVGRFLAWEGRSSDFGGQGPKMPLVAPGLSATTKPQRSLPNSSFSTRNCSQLLNDSFYRLSCCRRFCHNLCHKEKYAYNQRDYSHRIGRLVFYQHFNQAVDGVGNISEVFSPCHYFYCL